MVYDIHDPEFDFPENFTSTYSQNKVCPEKFPEMGKFKYILKLILVKLFINKNFSGLFVK